MPVADASLANLRPHPPWQPGESGNTRGRHRGYARVLHESRKMTSEALATIAECMRNPDAPWPSRLRACEIIIDRAWGAPDQKLHLDGADGSTIIIATGVPRRDEAVANETTFTITIPASAVEDTTP